MLNPELAMNRRPIDRAARNAALAKLAEAFQPPVRALVERSGAVTQDLLHGTPLGHPVHPLLTDVPIGSWTMGAVFDLLELAGRSDVAFASDACLVVGLLGGTAAIATGLADWSDTADEPRNLGMAHALLNGVAFAGYLASFALRRTGRRGAGIATAFASYVACAAAAYVGGELSFGSQLGVKHTAEPIVPPDRFTTVISEAALPRDGAVHADFNGIPALLARSDAGVSAISAVCTHRGAPLDQGTFADGCVQCPWHGSIFRLSDGSIVRGPASFPQPRFEARLSDGHVQLRRLEDS